MKEFWRKMPVFYRALGIKSVITPRTGQAQSLQYYGFTGSFREIRAWRKYLDLDGLVLFGEGKVR
jgi:hypothetical protein